MTKERRLQLVQVAREYDALIITDDVYDALQWNAVEGSPSPMDTAVQPRIVDIDRTLEGGADRPGADGFGNSVSNGSFSKIVGPGCRTGWAEGTTKFAHGLSQVYAASSSNSR
jgi:DNA-binding transcriptional MocR family regulator